VAFDISFKFPEEPVNDDIAITMGGGWRVDTQQEVNEFVQNVTDLGGKCHVKSVD
jgi:hypothetical protein